MKKTVVVSGSFDDLRSQQVRFLEEAAKLGDVHVLLWTDEAASLRDGVAPKFPEGERAYLLEAIRYVSHVSLLSGAVEHDAIPSPARYARTYGLSIAAAQCCPEGLLCRSRYRLPGHRR